MFDPFSCILLIHGITWIAKVISSSFQMVFVVHLVTLHRVLPICSPSSWNMVCWRQWAAFLRLGAPIHGLFQCLLGEVNLWHISLKFIPWWRYQDFFSSKNPMPWFGGMVDPSPTNYFQQKKSLKMSELDPLKKHFLECEQCSAACFSFFLGGWNFAETFRYVSTKESQKVFFLQTRSPPIFFWRARQRQTWCCFFKVNCRPLCVRVGNVALVRVKYRSEATSPQNYPTFSFCFLVGRISSPRKSTGGS